MSQLFGRMLDSCNDMNDEGIASDHHRDIFVNDICK